MKHVQSYKQKHGIKGKKYNNKTGHPIDCLIDLIPDMSPVFVKAMRKYLNKKVKKEK